MHTKTLSSGFRVLVEVRGQVPVVACRLRLGVGSVDEGPDEYGAAHMVEHMLFKGSRDLAVGEAAAAFESLGGDVNAWTDREDTVLHCGVHADRVDQAVDLLCRMAFEPSFDGGELERERPVILDEWRSGEEDAGRLMGDQLVESAWSGHPFARPVIGTEACIQNMSLSLLKAFHARFYVPMNAQLVVVGPVRVDDVFAAVERATSGLPQASKAARSLPVPVWPKTPGGGRVPRDFEERSLEIALPGWGYEADELPVLDLLLACLARGASALLPARMRLRESLVHDVWGFRDTVRSAGLLVFGFMPRDAQWIPALRALVETLREVAENGVPRSVLETARAALLSDTVYGVETVEGRAAVLDHCAGVLGDVNADRSVRARVAGATPREVADLAKRLLRIDQAVYSWVAPDGELSSGEVEQILRIAPAPKTTASSSPDVVRANLPNGVRLLVESVPDAPVTALAVVMAGGSLLERSDTAGLTQAWADLISEGAGTLDPEVFSAVIEGMGGSFRAMSGRSTMGLFADFPSQRFLQGLPIALLPLAQQRFHPAAMDRVLAGLDEALAAKSDDPMQVAAEALSGLLWADHPYRLPSGGTERSLARVGLDRVARLHRRVVVGSNVVVAVVGDVEPDTIFRVVDSVFSGLPANQFDLSRPRPRLSSRRRRTIRCGHGVAGVMLGLPTVVAGHVDEHALEVVAGVLGGQAGRLFLRLREQMGIGYDVNASHLVARDPGALYLHASCAPDSVRRAEQALREELQGLHSSPPDAAEVERVICAMRGSRASSLQIASARSACMAIDEALGLDGTAYRRSLSGIDDVSVEDVHRAIRTYVRPERVRAVVLRPEA